MGITSIGMLAGPIYAAGFAALVLGAMAYARAESRTFWQGRPFLWGAIAVVLLAFIAARLGHAPAELLSSETFKRGIAMCAIIAAAVTFVIAFRSRRRAAVCLAARPMSLDEAISSARAGEAVEGVFEGQVSCDEPVTSPGGIVCAAYDAELREGRVDGERGALLSRERAFAHVLSFRGERQSAMLVFDPEALVAKVQVRRCRVSPAAAAAPSEVLATGEVPAEALSFERVLRMGDRVRVVGTLKRGANEGSYLVEGPGGRPPMVLADKDVATVGKRLRRFAIAQFAASSVLCAAAAALLQTV